MKLRRTHKKQRINIDVPISKPERVEASPEFGLSKAQVSERIAAGLDNKAVEALSKTVMQIIRGNIFTYFNLIFFIIAAALIIVGAYQDLMFLSIVIVNTFIGVFQELHAKRTLDRLVFISEPKTTVVRDGALQSIPTGEAVLDDIVVFKSGNQIYADGVVLTGEIQVNEALVTGESDDILKREGDKLVSGSFVVSGDCRARLEYVGYDSFVSKLSLEAKKGKKRKQTGMMKALTRLLQIIGFAIIPVGVILYREETKTLGVSVKIGIENTAAALIGMIPQGLYLLVSVALAVSVVRLSKKNALVHDIKCIETLARVDMLCVDKTGTITENSMKVLDIAVFEPSKSNSDNIEILLSDFVREMPADNSTMQALKEHFQSSSARRVEKIKAFSSTDKYSAVSFTDGETYALGAPEFVLRSQYSDYRETIESYTEKGFRVLLLAKCGRLDDEGALDSVKPVILIMLDNPIRPAAKTTFKYFSEQGVEIKVISGDNPMTVSMAASNAGIADADHFIDASTLDTDEKIANAAASYTVFGRVTPLQKRQLIQSLQKEGHKVAMTGDGVNDVLALKAADCSIAMASGSEIASKVSQLVMLGSDFDSMPLVVAEGRRVINNIERTASLFLVKNIFSFILAMISVVFVFEYPLTPSQLTIIGMLTIGIPAFFLSLEQNKELVRGIFILNVLFRALPAALTNLVIVTAAVFSAKIFSIPNGELSTITAILITAVGFIMVWRVCRPFNLKRIVLLIGLILMFAMILIFIPQAFSLSPLSYKSSIVFAVLLFLVPVIMLVLSIGFNVMAVFTRFCVKKLKLFNVWIFSHGFDLLADLLQVFIKKLRSSGKK